MENNNFTPNFILKIKENFEDKINLNKNTVKMPYFISSFENIQNLIKNEVDCKNCLKKSLKLYNWVHKGVSFLLNFT